MAASSRVGGDLGWLQGLKRPETRRACSAPMVLTDPQGGTMSNHAVAASGAILLFAMAASGCAQSMSDAAGHAQVGESTSSGALGNTGGNWRVYRNFPNCYTLRYPAHAKLDTSDASAVRFIIAHSAPTGGG